jgi:hypothetical protein
MGAILAAALLWTQSPLEAKSKKLKPEAAREYAAIESRIREVAPKLADRDAEAAGAARGELGEAGKDFEAWAKRYRVLLTSWNTVHEAQGAGGDARPSCTATTTVDKTRCMLVGAAVDGRERLHCQYSCLEEATWRDLMRKLRD